MSRGCRFGVDRVHGIVYLRDMNNAAHTITDRDNDSVTLGVVAQADGTFLALTYTQSREFKTRKGAERWFASRMPGKAGV